MPFLAGLTIVMATFAAYGPAWRAGFIWDDDAHVTKPALRSISGLVRIWVEPGATQQYYPVVHSFFWMEHKLWGDWVTGYHLVNIAIHAAAALLLLRILHLLQVPGAWLAAAVFALHPVQVETVAWVTELKNTLSAVFYFGAALAYLGFDSTRRKDAYVLALALFVLGLLSKSVIATLPGALLVVFWWQRGKLSWKADVAPLAPFFAVGAASGLFTAWMERHFIGAQGPEFSYSIAERCLIAGRAVWFYLSKIFWPVDLIFSYPRWIVNQTVGWQYLFPAGVLLLLAALWLLRKRNRAPLAALLFFIGTLFPALGFMNVFPFVYSFVADHFQYLACAGPIVLAAAAVNWIVARSHGSQRALRAGIYGVLAAVLGILTWRQSQIYTSGAALWQATLERNPNSWLAHDHLGLLLIEEGDIDEGVAHYQKLLELAKTQKPPLPPFLVANEYSNLAAALYKKGELEKAIAEYKQALAINPKSAQIHHSLGFDLAQKGELNDAIAEYRAAIQLDPTLPEAHNHLGVALAREGALDQAIAQFEAELKLNPEDEGVRKNLERVKEQRGKNQPERP